MLDPNSATGDGLIHWILGGPLAYLIAEKFYWMLKNKKNGERGVLLRHSTFADRPDEYWMKMQQTVTAPIVQVLGNQTDILSKQTELLTRLDERTKR